MFDLTGKSALVTGASGDIGRAIALALHGQGARVALSGTRGPVLEALAAELGERAFVVIGDLGDGAGANAVASQAEEALGQIDILINNAGLTRDNLTLRMKDADFAKTLEVNLFAGFRLARAAMRGMMRRRWGRIISITSVVAFVGNPGQANYSASKAGMQGLTRSLAAELAGRGVTANCIAPGFVESAMTATLEDAQRDRILQSVPLGRMALPPEIASGAVFLASQEAAYVTGQTLHVNGGMYMA